MHPLRVLVSRLLGSLGRRRISRRELDTELSEHLQLLTEENIRRGMSEAEARAAAYREFGGLEQTKEAYRDQRGLPVIETVLQDSRFALRGLKREPVFALVAILTLALGIGATTAMFSVVDRILFRSLPYPEGDRLVSFGVTAPFEPREFMLGPDFVEWRPQQKAFESVTAVEPGSTDCDLTEQNPERLSCGEVDAAFLPTFRLKPILGRNFTDEEDRPNGPPSVLLSYGFWRSRFGGDPGVLRRDLSLDGKPSRIVGVLPPEFEMPTLAAADLVLPLKLGESTDRGPDARQHIVRAFARLKTNVSATQTFAILQPLFEASLNFVPPQFRKEVSLRVRSLRDRQMGDAKTASWILLCAVFAVLLVACTNVANLIQARATSMRRELAVRTALGATRGRLVRQTMTESCILGVLGGIAGCWVAYLLLRLFVSVAPEGIPHLRQASLDPRAILFTVGVAMISTIFFGLAPALEKTTPEMMMGKDARSTSRSFLRQTLITAQIAISLVLLTGAGLLLRSFWRLENVPLGMSTENILTAQLDLPEYRYPQSAQQLEFFRDLQARVSRLPGISALALSDTLPPSGGMQATFLSAIEIAGLPKFASGTGGMIGYRYITPEYFAALGIRVDKGRAFDAKDMSPTEFPVILSTALAKRLLGETDAVGKSFRFGQQQDWGTIVGVVSDVKNDGLASSGGPEFYRPWRDSKDGYFRTAHLIFVTPLSAKTIGRWVRTEAASIDPTVPVTIEPLTRRVEKLAERPRFNAIVLTLFAAMGMMLAAIGIYGVVGFLVARQTQEIGVRMALGATPQNILGMVLWNIGRWTLVGAAAGVLGAWFCARLMSSLLFDVGAHDPLPLTFALVLLFAVAFLAAYLPARRATQIDPLIALRYE
jgi:putative ABC transport system permease protein